ncbi:soap-1 [Pristionchus pacificus]|uniref:HEAT repeat-containing protein 5A n=1 Tax=Pristionchus pacificus TaxID=54126 RepID=A0A2A6CRY3_PRIPA|nr:soap-1 [Pristionchus pacificus]|eukprot:PDM80974.1 soap-1 [Pristionchus pacificus]
MEASHSLLLNEEALKSCAEQKRALFVYEWLRYLERILPATQKSDLRSVQKALMGQLESRLGAGPGPSTRVLLARCIARVYSVGDTSSLFATLNLCNDRLKAKDDSPQALSAKLAALACLGALYETVGRLVGRSYEDTFHIITKWLKTAESQGRSEMMHTLAKMVSGLGSAASTVHREIYKTARACAVDRNLAVRAAAIECLISLVPEYAPLYTTDIEGICTQCVKALDGSNHEIRLCVARLLSALLCAAHQPHTLIGAGRRAPASSSSKSGSSSPAPLSVEDCFQLLSSAFLRGGVGGFLKGGSSNQASAGGLKEVRVGIAMAYVEFIRSCGARWLERSSGVLSKHVLALAAKCGTLAYTNSSAQQSEAVLMRSCLSFILRSTLGAMLGEAAQLAAAKQLGVLLAEHINSFDYVTDSGIEGVLGTDAHSSGQAAIVAVLELSSLVKQIGTAVTPLFVEASGITEPIFACLIHPVTAARVATAWCLRCCTIAVPGLLTPLIDRCINRLEHMKTSGEAISGYSLALAALIAGSKDCQLGVPHGKPKQVLSAAEDLLRTAAQSSRLAVAKMSAGWVLLHALVSLGPAVVKPYLPRIIALWRAAFPRSAKEAENEKMRGDAFSWECALINRTGALSVMEAVAAQKELMDDDAVKAMQLPIECSLVVMAAVGGLVRSYGTKMRKQIAALRVRLYGLLGHLNAKCYEGVFSSLLRELVADITLSDNTQSAQATSLAGASCGSCLSVLAPWHDACDEAVLENGLNAAATTVGGAIENDVTELISGSASSAGAPPDPQLPTVASLDGAIVIYGKIFPLLPNKHRLQITEHCVETMKNAKPSGRQQAIQLNVLCALVAAYKNGGATSSSGSSTAAAAALEQLRTTTINLIMSALSSPSSIIRAVGAEALGRLAQAVNDPLFVASVAQQCFNVLQSSRDALTRSGVVLALGCLHRHVGSLGSGQYLNTGVKIALSLAQDTASPMVQSWALLSLSLIAETGGGMFAGYVEPMLTTCVSLLLSTPSHCTEVTLSVGKLLSALLTCVGPELGVSGTASGVETMRSCLLAACALLLSHEHAVVRAEGVAGLQQMHLFAPRHVHLGTLVIDIASLLTSRFISLRRASVSCLRQLVQREAREVREHAQALVPQGVLDEAKKLPLPETGLEGALFGMLDAETDRVLRAHVEETVISLVQATCGTHLAHWLALCKEVLATSIADSAAAAGPAAGAAMGEKGGEKDDEEDGGDDDMQLHASSGRPGVEEKQKLAARWPTRVFACQIVRRLMAVCESERAHLDLALAKELQLSSGGRADYLVLHLSDLVRMSFMGATSDNTQLRLAGLHCLQDVIARFSAVPEPEFPGHVLLEQFQAQVGAALRPAFTEDTPSDVTAAACQVCSTWISSKVARDLNDLRRVNQLLVSSLSKLKHGSINTQLYSESAATLEKLAILKAWAEVYITAVEQKQEAEEESKRRGSGGRMNGNDDPYSQSGGGACLLSLVEPELADLVGYWLSALRDSALLALPSSFSDQLPPEGGAFYKAERAEACREYYRSSWPPILLAASIWLRDHNFVLPGTSNESLPPHCSSSLSSLPSRLFLMIGVALDSLCSRTSTADDTTTHCALRALSSLMSSDEARLELMRDVSVPVEIVNVLHRLVLTRDNLATQQLCVDCAAAVMDAAMCCKAIGGGTENSDAINGNIDSVEAEKMKGLYQCDDGGESGELKPGMLSYAFMEFILAVVVRQLPQVNSAAMRSRSSAPLHTRRVSRLPPEAAALCKGAVQLMVQISSLCSPSARLTLLPVSLHLITSFIRESARLDDSSIVPDLPPGHLTLVATAALQGLRSLASSAPPQSEERNYARWALLMRSALLTILNIPTANSAHTYDECVVLLAAAILSSASPREVAVGHRESVEKLCVLAKHQLRRNEPQVVCKCLQALTSLFSRKDLAAVYARRLAPAVVEVLRPYVLEDDAETAVKEALEALIPAVAERNRLSVVSLISQSLTRLLYASRADEWRALSPQARKLHETALARLTALAPAYPLEFKQVLAAHPDAKRRLEAQLLFQSTRATHQAQAIAIKAAAVEHAKAASSSAQPSIKLTMDFNAFGKA